MAKRPFLLYVTETTVTLPEGMVKTSEIFQITRENYFRAYSQKHF